MKLLPQKYHNQNKLFAVKVPSLTKQMNYPHDNFKTNFHLLTEGFIVNKSIDIKPYWLIKI